MIDPELKEKGGIPLAQHSIAALVACGVSVIIHAAIMLFLLNSNVPFALNARRAVRELIPPIKLNEVRREDKTTTTRVKPVTSPRTGSGAGDLSQEATGSALTPQTVTFEPPQVNPSVLVGETKSVAAPAVLPRREPWQPRQEILATHDRKIVDQDAALRRRYTPPDIERVPRAPDIVVATDRSSITNVAPPREGIALGEMSLADMARAVMGGKPGGGGLGVQNPSSDNTRGPDLISSTTTGAVPYKALEKLLTAKVTVYTSMRDWQYGYFKLEINRISDEALPVVPKDIALVQDFSASITSQRLQFCKSGMLKCLPQIGAQDRFNVIGFRDKVVKCFDDWTPVSPAALAKAKAFIEDMQSEGNTDFYQSVSELSKLPLTPGRPVIALVVSDGVATAGLTDSTGIIGQFSKLNDGRVSVFTLGTIQTANQYLLDLVSFCNRGTTRVVTSGRWGIPDAIENLMGALRRPVLGDLRFFFAQKRSVEVYPVLTSNLYLDQSLVLYGRYVRKDVQKLVFQAIGKAGQVDCDMVFDLDLTKADTSWDDSIRKNWATQKVYHLIGQYARTPEPDILTEINKTSRQYSINVPYQGKF